MVISSKKINTILITMSEYVYSVGEIKKIIREGSQEFKPVLGPNVERDDKKNNEKSYKDSEKRAKDYDGGLSDAKEKDYGKKEDLNGTTIGYNPDNEPTEDYKKKVEAQAKGYTSELEEKNGNERGGVEMDKDGKLLKYFTDSRDEREKYETMRQKAGLKARTYPDEVFKKNHLVKEESKPKAKKLKFKRTKFINEQQALSRIPEEYKVDGQVIHLVDSFDNEYIVECSRSEKSGVVETNIVKHLNKKVMTEQVDRIFELMSYKTDEGRRFSGKVNESECNKILDVARENE